MKAMVKVAIMNAFILAALSLAQDRAGTPPGDGYMLIGGVLSRAHMSASLEYWGICNFKEYYPDFPKLRTLSAREGEDSPLGQLQKMFSVDPYMRVTEDDEEQLIRMVETDVPNDLLEVRIHHLHFPAEYRGPSMAIDAIMSTPEIIAFRKQHNIGPVSAWQPGFSIPGAIPNSGVTGDLYDVTARQALDYVLKTYPGFWRYENCQDPSGVRSVYIGFVQNIPNPPTMPTLREAPKNGEGSR